MPAIPQTVLLAVGREAPHARLFSHAVELWRRLQGPKSPSTRGSALYLVGLRACIKHCEPGRWRGDGASASANPMALPASPVPLADQSAGATTVPSGSAAPQSTPSSCQLTAASRIWTSQSRLHIAQYFIAARHSASSQPSALCPLLLLSCR